MDSNFNHIKELYSLTAPFMFFILPFFIFYILNSLTNYRSYFLYSCLVYGVPHILQSFFTLFHSFFLCSPLSGVFQSPHLLSLSFYIHLVYSPVDVLCCIFHFIHSSASDLFGLFLWFLFVEFLILLMYCFPACWVLCFIVAHWVSLEQLIWIIYQVNHRILSLSSVTRGLLRSFCDVTFHWFLMFLGVLHCCFLIWSSHLLQTLLVAFRSEILFIVPAYNRGFLRHCRNTCAPYFLASCDRNLKLLCLLSTLQLTRLAAGNLFCFS